jgi:hypothetical protein
MHARLQDSRGTGMTEYRACRNMVHYLRAILLIQLTGHYTWQREASVFPEVAESGTEGHDVHFSILLLACDFEFRVPRVVSRNISAKHST